MLAPLAQLWILVTFAIAGVLVGVAQMYDAEHWCPCCKLQVSRNASTCPHCRCRLD
ncbi:MAG: hypothetical protein HY262_06880 [Chloroflexi bacterium]|nr:hypothetical protein [Chloroflexota bacterium]